MGSLGLDLLFYFGWLGLVGFGYCILRARFDFCFVK